MKNLGLIVSCATLTALVTPVTAQSSDVVAPDSTAAAAAPGPLDLETSQNATVNLIRLLVKTGVITQEAAVDLIRQAEREAQIAQAQARSVVAAAEQIKAAADAEIAASESDIRVTYVPEHVRNEIATDVRNELAAEAHKQNWSAADEDSWTKNIRPFADLRIRYNAINFDDANDNTGSFPDFNAINTGSPYDLADLTTFYPTINADENRNRVGVRARLGFEADLQEGFTFGARLATGSGSSPVSTNQTVGSPGNFSKYSLWLDQTFLSWETSGDSDLQLRAVAGRYPNPFYKTDLTWDDDINLDGISLTGSYKISDRVKLFATAGIFPIFNTAFDFPSNQPDKFASDDRYMSAIQAGLDANLTKNIRLKAALAYYLFDDIEGAPSDPYVPLSDDDAGSTDGRRPGFAQKGNTYMPLRRIIPTAANGFGTTNQWQYFGLASEFRPIVATAQLDLNHFEPFQITIFGEAVKNTAYDVNRFSADPSLDPIFFGGGNKGGDTGYLVGVSVGSAVLQQRWDWRAGIDYRYLESDAFVDGFVDSDFGLGGTNLQGFTLSARLALGARVFLGARWLSASEIEGAPLRSDYFQFDINSKF
jgi:hypothetical protein